MKKQSPQQRRERRALTLLFAGFAFATLLVVVLISGAVLLLLVRTGALPTQDYDPRSGYLLIGLMILFSTLMGAVLTVFSSALITRPVNTLIGGIVKVIVNYILVGNPDIAITGAPVGTIACYAVITVLNLIAMRRVLRRNAPKLLPNLWKTTIAAVLMGGATWLAYWGLGRIGMGRAVACLGSIVVAVLVYVVLIIVLKVLTYEDCLLLPKGEKIAKILRVR